ncbi:ABC transporter substrate-binding protein [bacterium]|nr:ABC transporter substrate-binding protein [bacterium]
MNKFNRIILVTAAFCIFSCSTKHNGSTVVVAVKADPDQINPVTHVTAFGRILCTGLFPRLLESEFDTVTGMIHYQPLLAKRFEFSQDHKSLTYFLRSDIFWEDGERVTARDIKFTFELINHPDVASSKKDQLQMLDIDESGSLDKAIRIINDSTLTFNFKQANPLQIYDTNLQPGFLPYHLLKDVKPADLRTHPFNLNPLSAGSYGLSVWKKQEQIVYKSREESTVPAAGKVDQIVFRVIPEYTTRLTSLKTGEVDVMYPINPQDVAQIKKENPSIRIDVMKARYYDYVGWQNIDQKIYHESKGTIIKPHPLFGNKNVRKALTIAINRQEIVEGFLGEYGQQAVSPISPVFKWAINDSLRPLPYDPDLAKRMLKQENWFDHDGDGVIDRDGRKFEFNLYYDAGNDRREFAALIIQKNLEAVGIKVHVQSVETNVFYDNELKKNYDAFISGIGVTLQIDPTSEWNSDLKKNTYNDVSYQNAEVDKLIEKGKSYINPLDAAPTWKKFQAIIYEDQPATFLFWRDEIVGYNKRIKNTHTSILGEIDKYWLWTISSE